MNWLLRSLPAFTYVSFCWVLLSSEYAIRVGPGFFMIVFFVTILLGFFLIIMQVNDDNGDNGAAITTLSGDIIPAVPMSPERKKNDQDLQSLVYLGKILFFLLSIFILIYWIDLTVHGMPKEWWDKGYSFLIYMYAFAAAGKDYTHMMENFSYGDYLNAIGRGVGIERDMMYIRFPVLLGAPYAAFIYWVMRGHSWTSPLADD